MITIKGIRTTGVPCGVRWAKISFKKLKILNIIILIQRDRDRDRENLR